MLLPVKNALVKWWRSLTLGLFILIISSCMVLFNSFAAAVRRNAESAVINAFAGDIQVRSEGSRESDMVTQYNSDWDAIEPIPASAVPAVEQAAVNSLPRSVIHGLARRSVSIKYGDRKQDAMLIGIDDDFVDYRTAFPLVKGRYIGPGARDEILLTEELATLYKIDVGDRVTVFTKNRYGLNAHAELTVCGIGNFLVLSLFSYSAAYTGIGTVRDLVRLGPDEVTDLVLYLRGQADPEAEARKLVNELSLHGLKATRAGAAPVKSADLRIQSISEIKNQFKKDTGVKVSTSKDMGKTYQGMGDIVSAALNLFLSILLLVVFILITNLVFMTGFERFREIGTLRAIGISRGLILALFLGEIAFTAAVFSALGIGVGALAVAWAGRSIESPFGFLDYIMGKTLSLRLDIPNCAAIFLILMGFTLAASFFPAHRACSIKPARALRGA
jgi:ABC-type lipoprotein release transport system permease subunit